MITRYIRTTASKGFERVADKASALTQLLKLKLSLLVAFSGVFGFALAAKGSLVWIDLLWIGLGGLMVTGASNALNQIFEKDLDARMKRTEDRPLPQGRLNTWEAMIFALALAVGGIAILGYFFNLPAALLGIIALLSYAFVYTPAKRISSFCVFIGAIPGALPPLIGWVAFTGRIDTAGLLLFAFQFFWQFPHFWAIAWQLKDDYEKAGFKMLPTASGRSRPTARLILIYTFSLVVLAWFPWNLGMISLWGAIALAVSGLLFLTPAIWLYSALSMKAARSLMLASFLYLPLIQAIFLLA